MTRPVSASRPASAIMPTHTAPDSVAQEPEEPHRSDETEWHREHHHEHAEDAPRGDVQQHDDDEQCQRHGPLRAARWSPGSARTHRTRPACSRPEAEVVAQSTCLRVGDVAADVAAGHVHEYTRRFGPAFSLRIIGGPGLIFNSRQFARWESAPRSASGRAPA